jgi:hypothetical protein
MSTFSDYYRDLLSWENEPVQQLVDTWNPTQTAGIVADF